MDYRPPAIEMIDVTDPADHAEAQQRRVQFDRNSAWLQAHISLERISKPS